MKKQKVQAQGEGQLKGLSKTSGRIKLAINAKSVEVDKLVSSKIENTKHTGLLDYRKGITDKQAEVKKFVLEICEKNLLDAKLALWGAVREIEAMMQERRG